MADVTTVVTGYNDAGWETYGRVCSAAFVRHWPASVRFIAYGESNYAVPGELRLAQQVAMWQTFQQRYGRSAVHAGKAPSSRHPWRAKYLERGYNFRFDAVKFSKMVMYVADAARRLREGVLVWLDGDVLTTADVPDGFVDSMLPVGVDCVYLGRRAYHSETGFVAFRLPGALPLTESWVDYYISGEFEDMAESHSAYLFDRARERTPSVRCVNISGADRNEYWRGSPLGPYMQHAKGERRKSELRDAHG